MMSEIDHWSPLLRSYYRIQRFDNRKYWILPIVYIILNWVRSTKRDPENSNKTRVPSRWLAFYRMAVHGTMTIESFIFTRYPSTRATNVKGLNMNVIEFSCIIPSNLSRFSYDSKDNSTPCHEDKLFNANDVCLYSANGKLK